MSGCQVFKELVKKISDIWSWWDYNNMFSVIHDEYERETITWEELCILTKILENTQIHTS